MQKRTSGYRAPWRWLASIAALSMLGCPGQELAPLGPCTVSSVREEVSQTGVSKVDLLFIIDNSLSMAAEQQNLITQLPRLIDVLTKGDRYARRENMVPVGLPDEERFFTPVSSLHLGVITSEMAVMRTKVTNVESCMEMYTDERGRPKRNDDAVLRTSVDISTNGQISNRDDSIMNGVDVGDQLIAPRPACAGKEPKGLNYLQFDTAKKTPAELTTESDAIAESFGCIATVGALGCSFEQQLEAMWKAVAPSTGPNDFLNQTAGHGNPTGLNKGFVRDDAILAIIHVTDEEDCSITEQGRILFDTPQEGPGEWGPVVLNLRCGQADAAGRTDLIRPVRRYVDGLKSLKADNPDRIIFAGLVGIPEDLEDEIAAGDFESVLQDGDMQFRANPSNPRFPSPSCTIRRTADGPFEDAFPPRRFVQVAAGFGQNSALYSICRQDYTPAVDGIINRIASKLKGNCLPRKLAPDESGLVRCEVYEILYESGATCDRSRGHIGEPETRDVTLAGTPTKAVACKVQQVAVRDGAPEADKEGWYYDDFSPSLAKDCDPGEQQRIVFTDRATPLSGSGATFECLQPVASIIASARGFDAINTLCRPDGDDDVCARVSDDTYDLICVDQLLTCQASCTSDARCPPGWVCANYQGTTAGSSPKYCQQPTCVADPTTMESTEPTE